MVHGGFIDLVVDLPIGFCGLEVVVVCVWCSVMRTMGCFFSFFFCGFTGGVDGGFVGFCRLDVVVVRVWCSGGGDCGVAAHGRSATALVLGFFFFFWLVVVGVCGHGGVVVVWVGFNDGWVGIGGWVLVVSFFAMGFDCWDGV